MTDTNPIEQERDELRAKVDLLRAELDFVGRRYLADGSGVRFAADRCTGRSSNALAWYGVFVAPEPTVADYPADAADLAACQRTYDMAPAHVQWRMRPVLDRYQAHLNRGGAQ